MSYKETIQDYLLEEGLLREKIQNPKLEFGFQFIFPPGNDPVGRPIGQKMAVYKPKEKELIIIEMGSQIPQPFINALKNQGTDKIHQIFNDLKKVFLMKDLFFRIDQNKFVYIISDQFFLSSDGILSKNDLFDKIKKIFNTFVYSTIIVQEYCAGKVKPEDLDKNKEYSAGSDFTLYS